MPALRLAATSLTLGLLFFPLPCFGDSTTSSERAAVIGQPTAIRVVPANISLSDARARQQLIVTGQYADGQIRDLTPFVEFAPAAPETAAVDSTGIVTPKQDGTTKIIVRAGGQTVEVPVV